MSTKPSTFYEYNTYKKNKGALIEWAFADNVKIYEFIDYLYSLPMNNAVFPFDNSNDIVDILRDQWAGLFQRLLSESSFDGLVTAAQELNQGLTTLRQFMGTANFTSSTGTTGGSGEAALEIVEHPVFSRLKTLMKIKYRVFFMSKNELEEWLDSRSYVPVSSEYLDSPMIGEWYHRRFDSYETPHPMLKIDYQIFDDDGRLKPVGAVDWRDEMVRFVTYNPVDNINSDQKSLEER